VCTMQVWKDFDEDASIKKGFTRIIQFPNYIKGQKQGKVTAVSKSEAADGEKTPDNPTLYDDVKVNWGKTDSGTDDIKTYEIKKKGNEIKIIEFTTEGYKVGDMVRSLDQLRYLGKCKEGTKVHITKKICTDAKCEWVPGKVKVPKGSVGHVTALLFTDKMKIKWGAGSTSILKRDTKLIAKSDRGNCSEHRHSTKKECEAATTPVNGILCKWFEEDEYKGRYKRTGKTTADQYLIGRNPTAKSSNKRKNSQRRLISSSEHQYYRTPVTPPSCSLYCRHPHCQGCARCA